MSTYNELPGYLLIPTQSSMPTLTLSLSLSLSLSHTFAWSLLVLELPSPLCYKYVLHLTHTHALAYNAAAAWSVQKSFRVLRVKWCLERNEMIFYLFQSMHPLFSLPLRST